VKVDVYNSREAGKRMSMRRIRWTHALTCGALIVSGNVACSSASGGTGLLDSGLSSDNGDDVDADTCAKLTTCCNKAPDADSAGISACLLIASEGYQPACTTELTSFAPYDHDCK
jgi:hypothetical protein